MSEYGVYQDTDLGDNAMARLQGLAEQQAAAAKRIDALESELKEAKANYRSIAEGEMPDLLDELGISSFKTSNGYDIKVTEKIRGSLPANNAADALVWLEEHGHDKLVKRQFQIEFGKNEEQWAMEFEQVLETTDHPLNVKRKTTIHPSTLCAFVARELEEGNEVPLDLFGVYRQRIAKITVPK